MKYLKYIVVVCFLLLLTYKCSDEASILNNKDLIFHDSFYLKVKPYQYISQLGINYYSHGDTVYYTAIPDTFDSKPLLQWDSIGFKILTVAIFTSPIVVEGNTIKNSNDITWEWNSGMNFETYASIKYAEGKYVNNNRIEYDHEPYPLETGHYYWAVWAWNPEGTKIYFSTRQMSFYVQ